MPNNGVKSLAQSPSRNFAFERPGVARDLRWKNPFLFHVERSVHLTIMQPAMIHLFLVVPAAGRDSGEETSEPSAEKVPRSHFIQEHANRVLLAVEQIR